MSILSINKEPDITVGICHEDECQIIHPTNPKERIRLEGVNIGIDFHWKQRRNISIEGRLTQYHGMLLLSLPLERYTTSVISSEMNPNSHIEFLKAHAIISRGWALGKIFKLHYSGGEQINLNDTISVWSDTHEHNGFDVCADDHCQRFQGFDIINKQASEAVKETRGVVLTSKDNRLVDARFSKCCGGQTEVFSTCWQEVDYPEMTSVIDPYCDLSQLSDDARNNLLKSIMKDYDATTTDFFSWERIVSSGLIQHRLIELFGRDLGIISSLEVVERGKSGRIKYLRITGSKGSLTLGKELAIRRVLSPDCLYSSAFDISEIEGGFLLRGRGWGHGVGLCQIGAARMAYEGKTHVEILQHYYPGAILTKLYE